RRRVQEAAQDGASTQPADSSPGRPRSMREYAERQGRAGATTQPGGASGEAGMKIQADELKAADAEELAELEARARAEAGAPAGSPTSRPVIPPGPARVATRPAQ